MSVSEYLLMEKILKKRGITRYNWLKIVVKHALIEEYGEDVDTTKDAEKQEKSLLDIIKKEKITRVR